MNGLYLHCGAAAVDRKAVARVATPAPDGAHYPIPHQLLLDCVEHQIKASGMAILEEAHALTQGGARYFGMLRLANRTADGGMPADVSLVIGIRNTHDKAWSAALALGNHVFCCDNLAFSGEVLVGRKHTRNIERDLPLLIPRAFGALGYERDCQERRIAVYQGAPITDERAHDVIVRSLIDERIFPAANFVRIVECWRKPLHPEFAARDVWSLSNAYTEVAKPAEGKPGNLNRLSGRTRNLYGFLDREVGLHFRPRDEALEEGIEDAVTVNDAFARMN